MNHLAHAHTFSSTGFDFCRSHAAYVLFHTYIYIHTNLYKSSISYSYGLSVYGSNCLFLESLPLVFLTGFRSLAGWSSGFPSRTLFVLGFHRRLGFAAWCWNRRFGFSPGTVSCTMLSFEDGSGWFTSPPVTRAFAPVLRMSCLGNSWRAEERGTGRNIRQNTYSWTRYVKWTPFTFTFITVIHPFTWTASHAEHLQNMIIILNIKQPQLKLPLTSHKHLHLNHIQIHILNA